MSMPALTWARKSRGLTPTQKLVLMMMADTANETTGICWNAAKSLAEDTGLSDRAVRTALHDLIEAGAITGIMRSGVRPHWQLHVSESGTTFLQKRNGIPVSKRNHVPVNRKQIPDGKRNEVPAKRKQVLSEAETRSVKAEPVSDEPSITLIEPKEREEKKELAVREKPKIVIVGFDEWWRTYPRKDAKSNARREYEAAVKRGTSEADLLTKLRAFRFPEDPKFIVYAERWLKNERWTDEPNCVAPTRTESVFDVIAEFTGGGRPNGDARQHQPRQIFDFDGTAEEIPQ